MIQEAIGAIGPSAQWPNDPKSGPLAQIDTISRIIMYRGGLGGRTPPLGGGYWTLDPDPYMHSALALKINNFSDRKAFLRL